MSHQLVGKKWSFEIPPLNWKAPEADEKSERNVAPVDADASKDAEAARSTA
ncbi:hypothetical protein ACFWP0_03835 [Achromobacter sp. NPDC058515]|uniref:hypothetical protein n=1 Tax=Achromobacter sp. NPDC058515 TaxID=3346533 RepID=UPI003659509C